MRNRENAISVCESMKPSQEKAILNHMIKHGQITPLDALQLYGCMRLGARVYDLEHRGIQIRHTMISQAKTGKNYMAYRLEDDDA